MFACSKIPQGLDVLQKKQSEHHNVKYVHVWRALAGYWGGVKPAAAGMEYYDFSLAYPIQCPGIFGNQPDVVLNSFSVYGLVLVHSKKVYNFCNELHSYLASAGVDGIKVDVQNIIETLGDGHKGRESIIRQYLQALEASIVRNFPDNGCVFHMCHNNDGIYSAKPTTVIIQAYISSVVYNTLLLGKYIQTDWDMFHNLLPATEYHGVVRVVRGCAIYVSEITLPNSGDQNILFE